MAIINSYSMLLLKLEYHNQSVAMNFGDVEIKAGYQHVRDIL